MDNLEDKLDTIIKQQIIIYAKLLKVEKESKGTWSSSDFLNDAKKELEQKSVKITL
jgi:hypothetical protein